jgi:hypothetical protein
MVFILLQLYHFPVLNIIVSDCVIIVTHLCALYYERTYQLEDSCKTCTIWFLHNLTLSVDYARQLIAFFSPQSPGFNPMAVLVGFVVDKVALGVVVFFLCVKKKTRISLLPKKSISLDCVLALCTCK